MKLCFHFRGVLLLLVIVSVLSIHTTKASRLLTAPKEGGSEVKFDEFKQVGHSAEMELDSTWDLMGSEECDNGDEQCLKRRMISDAHLDYIYTQHHKP